MRKRIICFVFLVALFSDSFNIHVPSGKRTILIFPFGTHHMDQLSETFADSLYDDIEEVLNRSPYVRVIAEKEADSVIRNVLPDPSCVVDVKTALRIGKTLNADKVVIGEYEQVSESTFNVVSRLLDTDTGAEEGYWIAGNIRETETVRFAEELAAEVVSGIRDVIALEQIIMMESVESPFQLHLFTEKRICRVGEMITIRLKVERDCYVTVFDIGTSHAIHQLYPNRDHKDNFVRRGDQVVIENIRVHPPAGVEVVKAIGTLDRISVKDLPEHSDETGPFRFLGDDLERFTRGFQQVVSPLSHQRWTLSTLLLEIVEK